MKHDEVAFIVKENVFEKSTTQIYSKTASKSGTTEVTYADSPTFVELTSKNVSVSFKVKFWLLSPRPPYRHPHYRQPPLHTGPHYRQPLLHTGTHYRQTSHYG